MSMEYTENIKELIARLKEINNEVKDMAISVLDEGILKPPSDVPLGEWFEFDKELYLNEELDPNVKLINQLRNKLTETISELEKANSTVE
jgi:predicted DNA-binding antitoxin AbrB/MazE fold protein